MKVNKYTILCLGALSMALASCSDFLDQEPDERTHIDSEDKVDKLLVSAYPAYNPAWLLELSSDNLIDNQCPHLPSSPNDKQVLAHYNYSNCQGYKWHNEIFEYDAATLATSSNWDSPGTAWSYYYSSIATVNQAIQAMQNLTNNADPSTFTNAMKASWAEAHLLRAYSHFMLANLFCDAYRNAELSKNQVGIPYVTDCEETVQKNYDRGNLADTYDKIGADLEEGLKYVSDVNYTTAPKYHFNVNAAHAFASRFYLFKRDYAKVIEHADAVLTTDSAQMQNMMMDYSVFGDCSSVSDYGEQWQSPSLNNNLMLITTYSISSRSFFGYRYSCASLAARDALMIHNSPLWSGYICPATAIVSGSLLSSSSSDYGFFSAKAYEQFQYTNKLSGIGYPHIMYRAFTSNSLLLERAEAEIMLADYAAAERDLCFYWNSGINSFSDADKKTYVDTNYIKYMTGEVFKENPGSVDPTMKGYYSIARADTCEKARDKQSDSGSSIGGIGESGSSSTTTAVDKTYNRISDWSFTQQVCPDFIVPDAAIPYMNCLNDFRRFESVFEGQRMLDIKRWALPLTHKVGVNSEEFKTQPFNYSRAIEVPWEVISAGMATSKPEISVNTGASAKAALHIDKLIAK